MKILVIEENGSFSALYLERNIAGQGETEEDALASLALTIKGDKKLRRDAGKSDDLSDLSPAPAEYWKIYRESQANA